MKVLISKILNFDIIIFLIPILLNSIGLFTLHSITTANINSDYFIKEFHNQMIYSLIGIILLLVFANLSKFYFKTNAILLILYILSIAILIGTILWGFESNGAKRWIIFKIGGESTITIQPSEFIKIVIILITAKLLVSNQNKSININKKQNLLFKYLNNNKNIIISIASLTGITGLIFLQKSLSVVLVILYVYISILISSQKYKTKLITFLIIVFTIFTNVQSIIPVDHQIKIVLIMFTIIFVIFSKIKNQINYKFGVFSIITGFIISFMLTHIIWGQLLHEYQKNRLLSFFNDNNESIKDEKYQQYQSILSVGAGQIFGQGFLQIVNDQVLFLPESTTDFIFAIFAYKYGFIGVFILLSLYLILLIRIFYLSDKMLDNQNNLILVGIGNMILIQLFINIGMNIGLLPVGGTTLPFISAGGSSLISLYISLGIIQSIIISNNNENLIYKTDNVLINGWNR